MSKLIISLATVLFSLQVSAHGPCMQDKEKFCAGVEKGEGRIMKCMKDNEANLSSECKVHREKMKQAHQEVKAACQDDVETLCAGVEKGEGRIMKCMKDNKEKLSPACQAEMKEKKEMRKKNKKEKGSKDE